MLHGVDNCLLCNRVKPLTFHHLIPRTCHRNKWFRKHFSLDKMRNSGIMLCNDCHDYLHDTFPAKQLGRELNTIEAIRANEKMRKFIIFIKKKK